MKCTPMTMTIPAQEPFIVEAQIVEGTGLAYYMRPFSTELVDQSNTLIADYKETDMYFVVQASSGILVSPNGKWFYTQGQAEAFIKVVASLLDWNQEVAAILAIPRDEQRRIFGEMVDTYYQILVDLMEYRRETVERDLFLCADDVNAVEENPSYRRQFHPAYSNKIYRYNEALAWVDAKAKERPARVSA
jgi:hypothetical protein